MSPEVVNTSAIATFGTCSRSVDIGLRRLFPWVFVVAGIACAILGADFLAAFDLLVDCRQSRLHDKTTNLTILGISSSDASHQLAVLDPEPENPFRQFLTKYSDLTRPNFSTSIPPHDVVHHIRTVGPPVFSRPRFSSLHVPSSPETVLRGLPFVYAYINDLLVTHFTAKEHMEHLATVFGRLQRFSVVLNLSKCVFSVSSLEFLGYLVDSKGIHPLPSNVAAIRDFPPPSSRRQLQRLLDMVNFYRLYLPHCAYTILPPTSFLSVPKRSFEMSAEALAAFDKVKAALTNATPLMHVSADAPISLMVDASNIEVGAVLQQHLAGHAQPIASFSRKLAPAETR
nr:unnamed protein product [Spirometra erinaceieuropaei]